MMLPSFGISMVPMTMWGSSAYALTGGSTGAYGFGNGAEELMPNWVAAVPAPTASPSATKK